MPDVDAIVVGAGPAGSCAATTLARAGCSVVLMPSPRGALCSAALLRLTEEAGLPPGVLNLVPGDPAQSMLGEGASAQDVADRHLAVIGDVDRRSVLPPGGGDPPG